MGTTVLGVRQVELTLSSAAGPALVASSSASTPAALSKSCLRPPEEQGFSQVYVNASTLAHAQ